MLISPIAAYLKRLHERHQSVTEGKVADYIPELSKANPDWFGICIATRDGHFYEVGDTREPFTIQSISKAFVYGLALQDRGQKHVLARIGVEPSGDAFNAISLKPGSGAPFNPMINAGAIATAGQVASVGNENRIQRILRYLSSCAGRTLDIDPSVYRSESETGHRNRAIGWMLRNFEIIEEDPHEILETYFQQCSIRVTCRDLAFMGATLANQGVNPFTREPAIQRDYVDNILSVMATCGMYDYSGEWLYRVGLPAKSGVGGGIIAVLPGQLGIGIFSPPLDSQGNSVRGIRVCSDLSRDLSLHLFSPAAAPPPALRREYNSGQVASKRRRPAKALKTLRNYGSRIRVLELQGELIFSTVEPVVRELIRLAPYTHHIILDMRRVTGADPIALQMLVTTRAQIATAEPPVRLVFTHAEASLQHELLCAGAGESAVFPDTDAALESSEELLLAELCGSGWQPPQTVPLAQCHLLRDCAADDVEWLDARLPTRNFEAGQSIVVAGEMASEIFFITTGSVEVRLRLGDGKTGSRLDVFSAGMSFGEMAFLDNSPRSADVIAMEAVECRVIDHALFIAMEQERPQLKFAMLAALARQVTANLRQTNLELAAMRT
jgi:glutaminase